MRYSGWCHSCPPAPLKLGSLSGQIQWLCCTQSRHPTEFDTRNHFLFPEDFSSLASYDTSFCVPILLTGSFLFPPLFELLGSLGLHPLSSCYLWRAHSAPFMHVLISPQPYGGPGHFCSNTDTWSSLHLNMSAQYLLSNTEFIIVNSVRRLK